MEVRSSEAMSNYLQDMEEEHRRRTEDKEHILSGITNELFEDGWDEERVMDAMIDFFGLQKTRQRLMEMAILGVVEGNPEELFESTSEAVRETMEEYLEIVYEGDVMMTTRHAIHHCSRTASNLELLADYIVDNDLGIMTAIHGVVAMKWQPENTRGLM